MVLVLTGPLITTSEPFARVVLVVTTVEFTLPPDIVVVSATFQEKPVELVVLVLVGLVALVVFVEG